MQVRCPHCENDDGRMIEHIQRNMFTRIYYCTVCSKTFEVDDDTESKGKDSSKDSEEEIP